MNKRKFIEEKESLQLKEFKEYLDKFESLGDYFNSKDEDEIEQEEYLLIKTAFLNGITVGEELTKKLQNVNYFVDSFVIYKDYIFGVMYEQGPHPWWISLHSPKIIKAIQNDNQLDLFYN